MPLRAVNQLRENLKALMDREGLKQKDVAFAVRKHVSWVNKFLLGTRPIHLNDLDSLADLFGLTTYQLFVPGVSPRTERRSGRDRRSGQERRKGFPRALQEVAEEVDLARPRTKPLTEEEIALLKHYRRSTPQVRELTLLAAGAPSGKRRTKRPKSPDAHDFFTTPLDRVSAHNDGSSARNEQQGSDHGPAATGDTARSTRESASMDRPTQPPVHQTSRIRRAGRSQPDGSGRETP